MSKNLTAFLACIALLGLMLIGGYFDTPGGLPTGYVGAFNRHRNADEAFNTLPPMRGGRRVVSNGSSAFFSERISIVEDCKKEGLIKRLKKSGVLLRPTLTERQANLRAKLKERGFTNSQYIELQARALDCEKVMKTLSTAQKLMQEGKYEECKTILEDAISQVDSANLLVRQELLNVFLRAHLLSNSLVRAEDISRQLFQVSEQILEIKASTILMNDPMEKATIEKDLPLVKKYQARHSEMFAALRERHSKTGSWNGLLPEEIKRNRARLEEANKKRLLSPAQYAQALRALERRQFGPEVKVEGR